MRFEHPENLWFLLVIIPVLFSVLGFWMWRKSIRVKYLDSRLSPFLTHSDSSRLKVTRQVLVILSILFMGIASAQPQWGETNRPVKRTGIDIVFAIDLSLSMLAQDAAPNRLHAAKTEIESTLKTLKGDRVGLVVFTSVSFQQSPLTVDYGAIRFYLSKLKPHLMPRGGTSVGQAIQDSVELLTNKKLSKGKKSDRGSAKNQIVVLITDGEDHESDPQMAAKIAAEKGIKIFTVGIGSVDGEKIPIVRKNGRIAGYKKDAQGKLILSKLDEESLKQIAKNTNANYVHYTGPNSVANAIVDYVDTLEKSEIESLLKARYKERFYFFLIPAFLFLFMSIILGDRKKEKSLKKGALLLLVSFLAMGCDRPFESSLGSIKRGNENVAQKNYDAALANYKAAEKEIPSRPELHFDLGRALLGLQNFDDARREYARALETKDVLLEFSALNNLGLILSAQEKWKSAHETFSEAMDIAAKNPLLIDQKYVEETRWNLELAFRKLYPPCVLLEDEHEEDDSAEGATPVGANANAAPNPTDGPAPDAEKKEEPSYTLCGGDQDWFSIPAIPGTTVSITATFKDLRETPDLERAFLLKNDDVKISILNTDGTQVGVSAEGKNQSFDDNLKARTFKREILKFVVQPNMITQRGKDIPVVKLKVEASQGLEFSYKLDIKSIPPCYAQQEQSEDNNEINRAAPLQTGPNKLHTCPGDEDWFWVEINEGDSFFVDAIAQKDEQREIPPELRVDIFDASTEKIVAENITEAGLVTAGIRDSKYAGRFAVRVSGIDRNQQGPYVLDLYTFSSCFNEEGQQMPQGDDRLEENDEALSASALDMKLPIHRYLRHCPGDPDFYKLEFAEDAKDKSIKMGIALTSFPRRDGKNTNFDFDLMSPTGDSILVKGTPIDQPDAEGEKSPMPLHRGIFSEETEGQTPILRAHSGNDFYHLIQLNPQQPPKKQDENQESKPENEKDKSENEKKDDSQDQADKEKEKPKKDEKDKEKEEPKKDDKEKEKKGKSEPKEDKKENPELQRIQDLLEALEQNDDNFQLRKALEKVPKRLIEKDW